jgi:hypothetical protein
LGLWPRVSFSGGEKTPETGTFLAYNQESTNAPEKLDWLVELSGIEPLTSSLRTTRSPN